MITKEDMGRISCNQSMRRDTFGFTCGMEGLRPRGNMTCFRVKFVDAQGRSTCTLLILPSIYDLNTIRLTFEPYPSRLAR